MAEVGEPDVGVRLATGEVVVNAVSRLVLGGVKRVKIYHAFERQCVIIGVDKCQGLQ